MSDPVCYAAHTGLGSLLAARGLTPEGVRWLSRVCWDSPEFYLSLPDGVRRRLLDSQDQQLASGFHDEMCQGEVPFPRTLPRRVPIVSRAVGDLWQAPLFVESWSGTPSGMLNIEVAAAGRTDFTGARLAVLLEAIVLEAKWGSSLNSTREEGGLKYYIFAERCRASGASILIPAISLDAGATGERTRQWDEPPRKRLKMARALQSESLVDESPRSAIRHPVVLGVEAGMRLMCQSISKSWRQTASGLRAWGEFNNVFFPRVPHFPADNEGVTAFAVLFKNGGTFTAYLGHVHKG